MTAPFDYKPGSNMPNNVRVVIVISMGDNPVKDLKG